ncbi:MAG: glycosyltransferase, partial [Sediminispirochaetaceae bacterium]
VLDTIIRLAKHLEPDIWISDQLSYSVTIALMVLELPFISFCPPHPATIPEPGALYGVPRCWPKALQPSPEDLCRLEKEAVRAEESFDEVVSAFLARRGFKDRHAGRIFSQTSGRAVVFNYPCFEKNENAGGPLHFYLGYSFEPSSPGDQWTPFIHSKKKKIFISFGTFLSIREDVLRRIIMVMKDAFPDTLLLVVAGASADKLRDLQGDSVRIEAFVPQKGLLPHVDAVIHHGGVGTFTESLYFGKPSLVMPFSSDQFNVACDAERMKLGIVLDPNSFGERELIHGIGAILEGAYTPQLEYWHSELKRMGPRRVARQILRQITGSTILEEKEKA